MQHISEKDKDNILNIIDSVEKILSYVKEITSFEEFGKDNRTVDAVLMNLVVIGESVSKLSNEFKDINNEIDWVNIKGFRNIAVHDYFGVDVEEVWQIVENHIPKLLKYSKYIVNVQ
jgi:uncharacterized protein with HEPN domain